MAGNVFTTRTNASVDLADVSALVADRRDSVEGRLKPLFRFGRIAHPHRFAGFPIGFGRAVGAICPIDIDSTTDGQWNRRCLPNFALGIIPLRANLRMVA